jgi:hypothetical protein
MRRGSAPSCSPTMCPDAISLCRRGFRQPSRAVASREQARPDRPVRADRAVARRAVRRDAAADEVDPRRRRHAAGSLDDPVRLRHVRRQPARSEQSADHRRRTGRRHIDTGRHLASPKNTPLCNLYLALAHRMGLDIQAFGDSTGELKGSGRGPSGVSALRCAIPRCRRRC